MKNNCCYKNTFYLRLFVACVACCGWANSVGHGENKAIECCANIGFFEDHNRDRSEYSDGSQSYKHRRVDTELDNCCQFLVLCLNVTQA